MLRPLLPTLALLALCACTGAVREFYQDNAFLELVRTPIRTIGHKEQFSVLLSWLIEFPGGLTVASRLRHVQKSEAYSLCTGPGPFRCHLQAIPVHLMSKIDQVSRI